MTNPARTNPIRLYPKGISYWVIFVKDDNRWRYDSGQWNEQVMREIYRDLNDGTHECVRLLSIDTDNEERIETILSLYNNRNYKEAF